MICPIAPLSKARDTGQPVVGLEGSTGFGFRAVIPLFDDQDQFIGAFEYGLIWEISLLKPCDGLLMPKSFVQACASEKHSACRIPG